MSVNNSKVYRIPRKTGSSVSNLRKIHNTSTLPSPPRNSHQNTLLLRNCWSLTCCCTLTRIRSKLLLLFGFFLPNFPRQSMPIKSQSRKRPNDLQPPKKFRLLFLLTLHRMFFTPLCYRRFFLSFFFVSNNISTSIKSSKESYPIVKKTAHLQSKGHF